MFCRSGTAQIGSMQREQVRAETDSKQMWECSKSSSGWIPLSTKVASLSRTLLLTVPLV